MTLSYDNLGKNALLQADPFAYSQDMTYDGFAETAAAMAQPSLFAGMMQRKLTMPGSKAEFTANLRTFLLNRSNVVVSKTVNFNAFRRDVLHRMYCGDYWQLGAAWMGPLPDDLPQDIRWEIARYFASRNMVKECVDRIFDSIVGDDPAINVTVKRALKMVDKKDPTTQITNKVRESPKQDEQDQIDTYEAAFTNWFDAHDIYTNFVEGLPKLITRNSALYRIYIPYYKLDVEEGKTLLPDTKDMDEALSYIRLVPVDHANAQIIRTSSGDILGAIYTYIESGVQFTEVQYVDLETNETVLLTKYGSADWSEARCMLGGRLLLVEMRRRNPFVTLQALQLNSLVNVGLTMLGRNLTLGGFLERIITNAQMPGSWEDIIDPDTKEPTGEKKWVPADFVTGTATTNILIGVEEVDDSGEGTGKRATPGVHWRDPVDVSTFQTSDDMLRLAVYSEFKQAHVMLGSEASAGGRGREQALNDFSASIRFTARLINRGLSNIFDTVMALACWIVGDEEYVKSYKMNVKTRLTLKILTADEKRAIYEAYDRNLISAEEVMVETGLSSNPDATFELINKEQPWRAAFLQMQVQAGAAFNTSNGGSSSDPNGSNKGNNNPTKNKSMSNKTGTRPKSDNGVGTK